MEVEKKLWDSGEKVVVGWMREQYLKVQCIQSEGCCDRKEDEEEEKEEGEGVVWREMGKKIKR